MGDFTVLTRHPPGLLEADKVVHSHTGAGAWPGLAPFAGHLRFASVRNAFGVLNSAVFSINALTSEYLQRRFPPGHDAEPLRQRLAEYKLTDARFFASLAKHLARELEAYLPHRAKYTEMRWEDLIRQPVATMVRLGAAAQTPFISPSSASASASGARTRASSAPASATRRSSAGSRTRPKTPARR
ncbi:MAG: hypothetical protein ACT4P3_12800 [Betaproteobacteria bacterium]